MKCPGQDMQYWTEGAIFDVTCPECGKMVEFYKDDTTRKCHACGHRFVNPKMDFGCATYCQFAEQCLGTLPEEFVLQQDNLLKDKVAVEMKRYFKSDFKSISHASRVARHAEKIGKATEGVNLALILCSAYLHDIGKIEAINKHGNASAKFIQLEGPTVAEAILQKLGADENLSKEVCKIISHEEPSTKDNEINYHIVYDAHTIANLEDDHKDDELDPSRIDACLHSSFFTNGGRSEAVDVLQRLGVTQ